MVFKINFEKILEDNVLLQAGIVLMEKANHIFIRLYDQQLLFLLQEVFGQHTLPWPNLNNVLVAMRK